MASPDIKLLALLSNRSNYERFRPLVSKEAISLSETGTLLADYEAYYAAFPSETSVNFDTFKTFLRLVRHSVWKSAKIDAYEAIVERIAAEVASGPVNPEIIDFYSKVDTANKIAGMCNEILSGKLTTFDPIIEAATAAKTASIVSDDVSHLFGPTDLSKILETRVRSHGLSWRLDSLNKSAGPLHEGDLVLLMARPEAGKTSWLCSELTHMVKSLPEDKDAVIFNPEEGGGRVFLRLVTAATGKDVITVAADDIAAHADYVAQTGRIDRIRVVEPPGGLSTKDIERVLSAGPYGLVAINVLDKIRLPAKYAQDKEVDKYRSLAYWLRETANKYKVPILAVAQADAQAEGQKYLNQSMIYGSKTGVQGEVDLLIGMGYDPSIETRRYLSILKNKLPGGPSTIPGLKHAKLEVEFDPSTGRYSDL